MLANLSSIWACLANGSGQKHWFEEFAPEKQNKSENTKGSRQSLIFQLSCHSICPLPVKSQKESTVQTANRNQPKGRQTRNAAPLLPSLRSIIHPIQSANYKSIFSQEPFFLSSADTLPILHLPHRPLDNSPSSQDQSTPCLAENHSLLMIRHRYKRHFNGSVVVGPGREEVVYKRSPCPWVNTMANRGYIQSDGEEELIKGLWRVWKMVMIISVVCCGLHVWPSPKLDTWD